MKKSLALVLCVALALPGCATTGLRVPAAPAVPQTDPAVLAEYVQKLPAGSQVKVERTSGRTVRGTLMKATGEVLIVQPRTRIPEPALEIPLADVLSVSPDTPNGSTIGKAIGIGAAAGAGAALAVFLIIVAAYSD